ncbi:integrase core domain-containing protein [Profundibacter sp.]
MSTPEQRAGVREARKTLELRQEDYNWHRPHSALANLTPMEFIQRKAMDKMAA